MNDEVDALDEQIATIGAGTAAALARLAARRAAVVTAREQARAEAEREARAATIEPLIALASEYNATETEQAARLERLFSAMQRLSGHRFCRFGSGDAWVNCWPADPRGQQLTADRELGRLDRRIVELRVAGERIV